jgi:hypothetical protein
MLDGIAVIVEGEAVTTAEIRAVASQMRISQSEATDLLIQDRLQKSAMKHIVVDEKDVDNKIALIAKQNSLTLPKMQSILKEQGTSWSKYRRSVRDGMKKEKFFVDNILSSIPEPSKAEMKQFYTKNTKLFISPRSFSLLEYSAKSESQMKTFLKTQKITKGITSHSVKKQTKDLDATMLASFLGTPKGSFTPLLNAGDRYVSYKVVSQNGVMTLSFDKARSAVVGRWKQEQQGKALKEYFSKLKTNADIKIIRKGQ